MVAQPVKDLLPGAEQPSDRFRTTSVTHGAEHLWSALLVALAS